ncbi:hypothetical protein AGMMS50268_09580 [Spirochaetia bacterium]|nr:hypothetical protein AGMMS50268_09580 [Spirochaetia bacterium]
MGGVTFDTIVNKTLQLGGGKFEQGTITVAAGATIACGTLLKRSGNKFAVAQDIPPNPGTPGEDGGWDTPPSPGDIPLAIMPFDLKNESNAAADMGFRALIGGSVRKDMLNIGGAAITSAHADSLRNYGIIAVHSTDVSRVDPDTSV